MNRVKAFNKLMRRIVKTPTGCWEWQGAKSNGYGCIIAEKTQWWCHRLSWYVFKREIPKGKYICHRCDNPPCCNPDHLFLGTNQQNTADRHRKKRDAVGQCNGNSKVSDDEVGEIRRKYDRREGSMAEIAGQHRISVDQVRNIVRGKQRMHGVAKVDWNNTPLPVGRPVVTIPVGTEFGSIKVLGPAERIGRDSASLCECVCGKVWAVRNFNLRGAESCGCIARKKASQRCRADPPRLK